MNTRLLDALYLIPFVLAMVVAGCVQTPDRRTQLDMWMTVICDGHGSKKPKSGTEDYYTLFARSLNDPDLDIRLAAAVNSEPNRCFYAKYSQVMDAYIEGGQAERLREAILRAWRSAEPGTCERMRAAGLAADMAMREYLYGHPEVAKEAGLEKEKPPRQGWESFGVKDRRILAGKLVAAGDQVFQAAWQDYNDHLALSRAGKLRPDPWEAPQRTGKSPK